MDAKLQDRLRRMAPDFFRAEPDSPLDQRGIEVGDGWYPVLLDLGIAAQRVLLASSPGSREAFCLGQVKQKFARLTVYLGRHQEAAHPEVLPLIGEAVDQASKVCERCGGPGRLDPDAGYYVACDKHRHSNYLVSLAPHSWTVETVDGGPVGTCDFWRCVPCGASGGPVLGQAERPHWTPFLAGEGVRLAYDCDVAKLQVDQHRSESSRGK